MIQDSVLNLSLAKHNSTLWFLVHVLFVHDCTFVSHTYSAYGLKHNIKTFSTTTGFSTTIAWDNRVMLQRIGLLKVTSALMYVFRVKLVPIWQKMKAVETEACELPSLQYSRFNLWALYRDNISTKLIPTDQVRLIGVHPVWCNMKAVYTATRTSITGMLFFKISWCNNVKLTCACLNMKDALSHRYYIRRNVINLCRETRLPHIYFTATRIATFATVKMERRSMMEWTWASTISEKMSLPLFEN